MKIVKGVIGGIMVLWFINGVGYFLFSLAEGLGVLALLSMGQIAIAFFVLRRLLRKPAAPEVIA